jgi:hypothetical protein
MTEASQSEETGRLRQFWVIWRGWLLLALLLLIGLVVLGVLGAIGVIETGFGPFTPDPALKPAPVRAKTLWDWMDLLLVPFMLAIGAAFFTWVTDKRTRDIEQQQSLERQRLEGRRIKEQRDAELDHARETALQTYLDRMTDLIGSGLLGSGPEDARRSIARARTLTVLRQLDGDRKRLLLRFLFESGLLGERVAGQERRQAIVNLSTANLAGADLGGVNLMGADLRKADLMGANLSGANLIGTDLMGAHLGGANLESAYLTGAYLMGTNLGGANLRNALLHGANLLATNLGGADLSRATLSEVTVTDDQLAQAASLAGAILPDGTVHE